MAVGGIEEVELEVLPCLVRDLPAVEHDPADLLPGTDQKPRLVAARGVVDPLPARPRRHLLEVQPREERHLDRVLGALPVEELEHVAAEERPIHAEFQLAEMSDRASHLPDQRRDEAQAGLAVVDVARTVLCPHDAAGLRLVGGDRVVARHLSVVRVEAPARPFYM